MKTIGEIDYRDIITMSTLGLTSLHENVLEKDILVTEALRSLSLLSREEASLVFCGGTCLSKAHKVITRMSEDIDFKIVVPEGSTTSHMRRVLSGVKEQIREGLLAAGFSDFDCRARNGNRFFSFNIPFESRFERAEGSLRPFIRAEFMTVSPQDTLEMRPVTTLVDEFLDKKDNVFPVQCLSLRETLVEKTVALLRRLGDRRENIRDDPYLIRHIYDMHKIVTCGHVVKDMRMQEIFNGKVAFDSDQFASNCHEFTTEPVLNMKHALDELISNPVHSKNYERLLKDLIFEGNAPVYNDALVTFISVAVPLIEGMPDPILRPNEDEDDGPSPC